MDHEQVFAEEAREETVLSAIDSAEQEPSASNQKNKARTHIQEHEGGSEDEYTPLVTTGDIRQRQPYKRAGDSYERAIHEPWTGAHGENGLPWYKTPSIFWLLPAFFPFCIALGGTLVPKTYLVLNMICKDYLAERAAKDPNFTYMPIMFGTENPQCRDAHVQTRVANFNIYQDLLSGLFAAIVSPHLGALSDRVGRKKVIVVSSAGALVTEITTIIVGLHPDKVSVYWLLLGAFIDGISGSFIAGLALSFAYASDCTAPEKRAVAFGYFHGALFTGFALGPIFAAWVIKMTGGIMAVFYIALGCHFFFMTFTTFAVPESLSKERQYLAREIRAKKLAENPNEKWLEIIRQYNLFQPLWVLRPTGAGSSPALRQNLFVLAAIDTMMFGVAMGTMRILLIYAEFRFGWDAVFASMFLSSNNVIRVFGLVVVLPLLTRVVRGRQPSQSKGHKGCDRLDIGIIRTTIVFDFLGYLGYALTPSGALMFVSGAVAALGGMGSPTLQSSMTQHIPAAMTGQMLGASGLLHSLARVVSPALFNLIYGQTVDFYPGLVFLCLASVFVIVFIMSWFLRPNVYMKDIAAVNLAEHEDSEGTEASSS